MKELANNILAQIEVDISEIDLYGYNIIDVSLSIVHRLQTALNDLRMKIQTYIFPTKEDEILFFKTQKPEILGRLLFFYKIYLKSATPFPKCYLHKEKWTFDS